MNRKKKDQHTNLFIRVTYDSPGGLFKRRHDDYFNVYTLQFVHILGKQTEIQM